MNNLFSEYSNEPLYIQLYMYFRDLIISGAMKYGDKLPSVRKCAAEFSISKMTVESAYMQLTAEGYVFAKSQSGYYVSEISDMEGLSHKASVTLTEEIATDDSDTEFDLSGSSVDLESFDFKLWQKYVKNALRCEDRLLSYGAAQGEPDLRKAISEYASKERGVVCSASRIVIGAGVQSLLQLLCALDGSHSNVIFSGSPFRQGRAVFEDNGYNVINGKSEYNGRDKVSFVYTSPSHSNKFSDVMNISKRVDLINFAKEHSCIIIEDDYDSEFCYLSRPVSSLQGLDGGKNVVYIGTFSKLLLPSIRISFMVLPEKLMKIYEAKGEVYNQTASKTEQIALARYITDMRLVTQIRKARKHYENKALLMKSEIERVLLPESIKISDSGFMIYFVIKTQKSAQSIGQLLNCVKIKIRGIEQIEQNKVGIFVSSVSLPEEKLKLAISELKSKIFE